MEEHDLVSIIVMTYNSSNYVLETLESAKKQSYRNIELIITDDSSTDDTVEICREWIGRNEFFFKNVILIESDRNKGIPGNCNKGLKVSTGKWVKLIAGDDILLENCIESNLSFIDKNKSCKFLFSRPVFFDENHSDFEKINATYQLTPRFYNLSAQNQFYFLLIKNYPMSPPTLFYKRSVLISLGGYDERFPNEDFPLYLMVTKAGYKLFYNSVPTVKYRCHSNSISFRKNNEAVNFWKRLKFRKTVKQYISKELIKKNPFIVIDFYIQFLINEATILLGNKKSIYSALRGLRILSPLYSYEKLTGKNWIR